MKEDIIQQQQVMDQENTSNLTSASGDQASTISSSPNPQKKKRNLPGNPDPEAEVIALSPNTLMATNRFVCEICNKGFQRDQNLQLHRRGHNLPWKLKLRNSKEMVRKKVYICPEVRCVHHEPCRALGDLTGIKKHFSRKHGDKKWKCDKCSKKYAVHSDFKAHSKICGTREYRCDCGTLFSRRDSFITHRAFCDALAEESAREIPGNPLANQNQILFSSQTLVQDQLIQAHDYNAQANNTTIDNLSNSNNQPIISLKREHEQHHFMTKNNNITPPWLAYQQESMNILPIRPHEDNQQYINKSQASPHLSATALLQKAAQMGATMSTRASHLALMAKSPISPFNGAFENEFGVMIGSKRERTSGDIEANEGLTRDFLGLRAIFNRMDPNSYDYEQEFHASKRPWHG